MHASRAIEKDGHYQLARIDAVEVNIPTERCPVES